MKLGLRVILLGLGVMSVSGALAEHRFAHPTLISNVPDVQCGFKPERCGLNAEYCYDSKTGQGYCQRIN